MDGFAKKEKCKGEDHGQNPWNYQYRKQWDEKRDGEEKIPRVIGCKPGKDLQILLAQCLHFTDVETEVQEG